MNTQTTIEKMKQMRMNAMSDLYHRTINEGLYQGFSNDEFMALFIDTEWENREHQKIKNLIKNAGFKLNTTAFNVDYSALRHLDRNQFERLLSLQFIKQSENIMITGATGVGKSYLSQAIGITACQQGLKVLYIACGQLIERIKQAKIEGTYLNFLKNIQSRDLLIIDDFGLHSFDQHSRQALMDIIENRHEKTATIISSQIPVSQWHETIGEGTIADAILDRMVYSSHRIDLQGESLRKNKTLKG